MTTPLPTRPEAEAAVRTAEERLAALREEQRQVNERLREIEAERVRLLARESALYRPSWGRADGDIPRAGDALATARAVLSDLDAPGIRSDNGTEHVIISAGPRQVKVRTRGAPSHALTTLVRGAARQNRYGFYDLNPADLEAATAAFDATRKAKR